jgi:N-acetyl-gamma-glutamyl-phosphate reductase
MIKVGIIGSTGYAGQELVRILLGHKEAEIIWYGSRSYVDQDYSDVYGNMFKLVDSKCLDDNLDELSKEADVIFTATPQGYLAGVINEDILSNSKIIDISADFRLKNAGVYTKWYGIEHKAQQFLHEAVYGLCELNRDNIRGARLIANPGCYTTTSILSLYPLVREHMIDTDSIIIDAKSGTSGAGRGAKVPNLYCEVNESIKAYAVASHRHTPEIEEQLGYAFLAGNSDENIFTVGQREYDEGYAGGSKALKLNFTPHLIPMDRGILATSYAKLTGKYTYDDIRNAYEKYYKDEYFIRLLKKGVCPETRWVKGSNFVDINFVVDERTNRVVVMGALDNVVKGAAGQAVQNMNLLFGLPENTGLKLVPMFP